MTTLNTYASLQEFKNYYRSRGGDDVRVDATDDSVLEFLLMAASDHINNATGRKFYPTIETRYFDVPGIDEIEPRLLELDNDLLEVISITNGDGVTVPSTEYSLRPKNASPYYGIRLIDNSTYYWASDGAGDTHDVIAVNGIWGYHDRYASAWLSATTLAEILDTSETGFDLTAVTSFAVGNLIRIENEFSYVSAISTNTLTATRGENYSTAATHANGTAVKIWQTMNSVKGAVLEIANNAKARRFGQSLSNTETVTASGIVLSPRDVPAMAQEFIKTYRRYT